MSNTADLINKIPAKRWFLIRHRLDMSEAEIMESPVAILVVAANEIERQENGRDDYAKFLEMNLEQLNEIVNGTEEQEPADDAESKSVVPVEPVGARVGDPARDVLPDYPDFSD